MDWQAHVDAMDALLEQYPDIAARTAVFAKIGLDAHARGEY